MPESRSFAGLVDELAVSQTPDAAWTIARKWLSDSGVDWCHYVHAAGFPDPRDKRLIRYSSLPQAWLEHYEAEGYFRADPAVPHCFREASPLIYPGNPPRRVSGRTASFLEDALGAGFRGSVTLPLRLPGSVLGSFSLITCMQGDEFAKWHQSHGRWITLAVHVIDARLIELVSPSVHVPRLSHRERECLTWLAAGLRYDRIAERLGISIPTVELHIANARRKLGGRTREHAPAIAVALGLLDP